MKIKFGPAIITLCLFGWMVSCTPISKSAHIINNKKLQGKWALVSITPDDTAAVFKPLPIFEDVPTACLVNSAWLLDENDLGEYNIPGGNGPASCIKGTRKINWLILEINGTNFLQFRRAIAVAGVKTDRFSSYILEMESFDKKVMKFKYPIYYKGQTTWLHFNFGYKGKN